MVDLAGAAPKVLTVFELTRAVRGLLEDGIGDIWVEGEISNFRRQSSGHQYFTLKDDRSQLSCVFFRLAAATAGVDLADGMHVQIFGALSVYESRGQYQLVVELVQTRGVGVLQARFEALKKKLSAEGLFDLARKRPLPAFPLRVGIVTSPTGAALQDMLNILRRRAPWMRVLVHPVRVQGQGASLEIASAIEDLNSWADDDSGDPGLKVDLIVVARGGGSIEDLWEFNEEIVARAIAASGLPVVSAVGHEIDFTIADFAADVRAPTPSAAAEIIAPDSATLRGRLAATGDGLSCILRDRIERARERMLVMTAVRLGKEPQRRVLDLRQQIDLAQDALTRTVDAYLRSLRAQLDEKSGFLRVAGLRESLVLRSRLLETARDRVKAASSTAQTHLRARLRESEGLLRVLGPQGTLERGYSITLDESGAPLRSTADIQNGQRILTRLHDGELRSTVVK